MEEDRRLAREGPGIDVIVGGHCHTALHEPLVEGGTVIVQAGSLVEYLGCLELSYSPDKGGLRVRNEDNDRPFLIPIDDRHDPHQEVSFLVEEYRKELDSLVREMTGGRFEHVLEPVAPSDFVISNQPPLQESPAGDFITDAMRLITQEVTGKRVDVAIQANGSIRGSIFPGELQETRGDVSFYDITDVIALGFGEDGYPGYSIVSLHLTGEEIRRMLEVAALLQDQMGDTYFLQFSGLRFSYNPDNAVLFNVPFIDQPIPTTRAVLEAELFSGERV